MRDRKYYYTIFMKKKKKKTYCKTIIIINKPRAFRLDLGTFLQKEPTSSFEGWADAATSPAWYATLP